MQPSGLPDPARSESATPAHATAPTCHGAVRTEPGRLAPALRVSDRDRDGVAQILQAAFAEGRLDDDEFDERMRAALTARTAADLEQLTADLPAAAPRRGAGAPAGPRARPVRDHVQELDPPRRAGGGCPSASHSVVYKGSGWLDLRAAELTAHDTTMLAVAYKSRIDILVPPGVRVELDGLGVSKGWSEHEDREARCRRRPGGARARLRLQGHHRGQHAARRARTTPAAALARPPTGS